MSQPPEGKPVQGKHTARCGHCSSQQTTPHCYNVRCTWVKCGSCNKVSDTRKLPGGTR